MQMAAKRSDCTNLRTLQAFHENPHYESHDPQQSPWHARASGSRKSHSFRERLISPL
jgi:hypothetical protein